MSMTDALGELERQLTVERKRVDVANHNFSARELTRMMAEKELNVAPSYQRKFRWDASGESVFIESLFLGFPIPPIFVATNVGFQWEVVDGLQRLSTLIHYMSTDAEDLARINREEPLKLEGLEKLTQLNGTTFLDLPKSLQVYFARQPLQVVSLTDKSDNEIRYDLFERLNKGAIKLSPQEVRTCVYRGPMNEFLEKLAVNPNLVSLLKLQEARKHDGTKAEQVLKFFAYKNARHSFDGRVEKFLNKYMVDNQKAFDYSREQHAFERAAERLYQICDGPFLRADHSLTPLVQFEACLVAIAELQEQGIDPVTPDSGWTEDPELKDASTGGTNTKSMLRRRIDRAKVVLRGDA